MKKETVTPCKNCYFAKYDGRTQIDCNLGLLSKHTIVIPAYDQEKDFFVIKGVCRHGRTYEWAKSFTDPFQQVKEEVKLKYEMVVTISEDTKDMKPLFEIIDNLTIKPTSVVCIITKTMQEQFKVIRDNMKVPYRIEVLIDDQPSISDLYIYISNNTNSSWYLYLNTPFDLDLNLVEDLNIALNEEMTQIGVVAPARSDFNQMMFTRPMHCGISQDLFETIPEIDNFVYEYNNHSRSLTRRVRVPLQQEKEEAGFSNQRDDSAACSKPQD